MAERDVFFFEIGGWIVGTIALAGNRLHSMFVEQAVQKGGLGRRLVVHLETHARKSGAGEIRLSSSLTAHGFYEKLGYRKICFEKRDNGSTYLMAKAL